jgi:hypothetical protein
VQKDREVAGVVRQDRVRRQDPPERADDLGRVDAGLDLLSGTSLNRR